MSSTPRKSSAAPMEIRGRGTPGRPSSPSPSTHSHSRRASTVRLASPVPSSALGTPPVKQVPTPAQVAADKKTDLPGLGSTPSSLGPGTSALAEALRGRQDAGWSGPSTPPRGSNSPAVVPDKNIKANYGSFDNRSVSGSPATLYQDPEVIKRHLVQGNGSSRLANSTRAGRPPALTEDDEFSSLQLQGGDIHRPIYKYAEENQEESIRQKQKRSKSFDLSRPEPASEVLDINSIKVPGGFRRNYLRRAADSPDSSTRMPLLDTEAAAGSKAKAQHPKLLTNNFLEFLTLYGHFAGEELEEDDEVLEEDEYFDESWEDHIDYADQGDDREPLEDSALLTPGTPGKRRRKHKERPAGTNTAFGAAMLLLKSFVGTGVLFLPKAYLNGGMLFSNLVLLGVSILSYYCFILLVNTRLKVEGSFGEMGGVLYGKYMRALILGSIVVSQMGFVAAYIVFVSENLQAFVLAITKCKDFIDIKYLVLMQLVVFLPLSLIRDISKLGFTALIADFFILLGLIYLYYYDIATIVWNHGIADVEAFNPSTWTLFIGTAIFTFEGVGLIIPIQESMKNPKKFPGVLAMVMIGITVVFMSMGALSYAAYGSSTKTVVLLNLPQENKFVNTVQFLYSLAILLSTPLQLFPAIRIMENELFTRSGKYNRYIKWKKNGFRFVLVFLCAAIAIIGAGDLDKFVALVGSFACVPLVYIYPPMLHLRAVSTTRRQTIMDIALCIFGAVGCVYTTALTINSWVNDAKPAPDGYCDTK